MTERKLSVDPLSFIKDCVREKRILWTYHVNMRMKDRYISRDMIMKSVENYELIESYPKDKYLPSYLVYSSSGVTAFHLLFAIDQEGGNVRLVTAYRPDPLQWESDLKRRKKL